MDYLDAAQIARLECLKLVAAQRLPADQLLATVNRLARFVLDGTVHDPAPSSDGDAA